MAWLNERQALLLQLLSEVEHPLTGHDLATLLGISTRTLRYDISRVNRLAGADVVVGTTQGYRLDSTAYQEAVGSRAQLAPELVHEDRVLLHLLDHPRTNVFDIMVDCYLGEAVVRATLRTLKAQLETTGVTVTTQGSSVSLEADELGLRRILGKLVRRAMDTSVGRGDRLARYLPDVNVPAIQRIVAGVVEESGTPMDDIRLESLAVTVAICLQRAGQTVGDVSSVPAPDDERAAGIVVDIASRMKELYPGRELSRNDLSHLCRLVSASLDKAVDWAEGQDLPTGSDNVREVLAAALDETVSRFNLTVQRDKLHTALEGHIRRMIRRVDTMLYFRNSLQDSLHSRSPLLYDVAVFLADRVSRALGIRFTDDEIGLLAIYFGLYSEQQTAGEPEITAVLVCPRYQTLQDWLIAGLVERYVNTLRIIDIVPTPEEADAVACDLVITTFEDPGTTRHSVQISAVLSPLDVQAIDAAISRARDARSRAKMARVIARFLDRELFFVGPSFPDSTQAIRFLSDALETRKVVPPTYLESVLLRETYSSTAFARRFAIPHSMDFMAYETKVAVLIPSSPIRWEDADVTLVLQLAINGADYDDFVDFYQPLVRLLYDPQLYAEVRKAANFDDFRDLLGKEMSVG